MLDYIANKDISHEYLAYYRRAYKNVPLWVAVNAMTFGQISKMLTALRDNEKARIAKRFGVGNPKELRRLSACSPLQERLRAWRAVSSPTGATSRSLIRPCTPSSASRRSGRITLAARWMSSAVIALRYLLRDDEFKAFKAKLAKCVNGYLSSDESIGEEHLL